MENQERIFVYLFFVLHLTTCTCPHQLYLDTINLWAILPKFSSNDCCSQNKYMV